MAMNQVIRALALAAAVLGAGVTVLGASKPIIIAHRGASGHRPEHTLAAYELAIEQGADFVEPDLVITKDGTLIARHENEISGTTDVADRPEFANRKTAKPIQGRTVEGWFAEDFTLEELKTLRARERLPELRPASAEYDGQFEVPTLQEIIDLVRAKEAETGRTIGLYIETKNPSYFRSIGLPLEEPLLEVLAANGYEGRAAPVFLQSFEVGNLKALAKQTELPLVQLLSSRGRPFDFGASGDPRTYADLATPAGLAKIARYAQGIGPNKDMLIPRASDGSLGTPTRLVADAHAAGLVVHPWTFRSENVFLPNDFHQGNSSDPHFKRRHGDAAAEYRLFFDLGVDGLFSDHPDAAVAARDNH